MVKVPSFDIKLHSAQAKVFHDPARFKVMVCGRRFGKTQALKAEMIAEATLHPNRVVWYVAPTYKQAKRLMWKELKAAVKSSFIKKTSEV